MILGQMDHRACQVDTVLGNGSSVHEKDLDVGHVAVVVRDVRSRQGLGDEVQ